MLEKFMFFITSFLIFFIGILLFFCVMLGFTAFVTWDTSVYGVVEWSKVLRFILGISFGAAFIQGVLYNANL